MNYTVTDTFVDTMKLTSTALESYIKTGDD